jgi:chromosome condensin MukBEF complex kleisin-like MukF subunit
VDDAIRTLATLANEGLDVEALGEKLQVDGVGLFAKAYDELLQTIEDRRNEAIQNYSKTKKISIGPGGQILDN